MFRLAGVIESLVNRDQRLEVVQEIRAVERADGEILFRELMLREQRAEDKHRVVAARERLGIIHFGEDAAVRLSDARIRCLHPRGGGGKGPVLAQRQLDGVAQR